MTASQRVIADQIVGFFDKNDYNGEINFPSSLAPRDRKFAADLAQSLMLQYDQIGTGTAAPPL